MTENRYYGNFKTRSRQTLYPILALILSITAHAEDKAPPDDSYQTRVEPLMNMLQQSQPINLEEFEHGVRKLISDFPHEYGGYNLLRICSSMAEADGKTAYAANLLREIANSDKWLESDRASARGALRRLDNLGQPFKMKFTATNGTAVDLEKMRGKVVLIDFWATWCGPCMDEMPRIAALRKKLNLEGFEVVGISLDSDLEKMKKVLTEQKFDWPQSFDGKSPAGNKWDLEYGISGVPHKLLIDKNGKLRYDIVRGNLDIETKIRELLAE